MNKENALRRAAIAAHVAKVASQEKKKALRELMEVMNPGIGRMPQSTGSRWEPSASPPPPPPIR